MADPNPGPPSNYPNAPPPPAYPQGGYPPQGYPGWQAGPPPPYRGPMLPSWLSFGAILALVGGVLVMIGFLVQAIADTTYASATSATAFQSLFNSMAVGDVLIGVGILIAVLGWMFHQMSTHRHPGH